MHLPAEPPSWRPWQVSPRLTTCHSKSASCFRPSLTSSCAPALSAPLPGECCLPAQDTKRFGGESEGSGWLCPVCLLWLTAPALLGGRVLVDAVVHFPVTLAEVTLGVGPSGKVSLRNYVDEETGELPTAPVGMGPWGRQQGLTQEGRQCPPLQGEDPRPHSSPQPARSPVSGPDQNQDPLEGKAPAPSSGPSVVGLVSPEQEVVLLLGWVWLWALPWPALLVPTALCQA